MSALRVSAGERKGITGDERIFLETTGAVLSISHDMEAGGRGILSHYCRGHGGAKKSCQKYFQIWKHITVLSRRVMCISRLLRASPNPDLRLRDDHRDRIYEILRGEKWKRILTINYTYGKRHKITTFSRIHSVSLPSLSAHPLCNSVLPCILR